MTLRELGRAYRVGLRVKHRKSGETGRLTGEMHEVGRGEDDPVHAVDTQSGRRLWFESNIERLGEIMPFSGEGER